MPEPNQKREPAYAMWVVLAGIASVAAVTIVAILHYKAAADLVTALGPVSAVIGTLVGAYFGLRGSSLAQQNANTAELQRATLASAPPNTSNGSVQVPPKPPDPAAGPVATPTA